MVEVYRRHGSKQNQWRRPKAIYRSQQIDTAYQRNQDDSAVMRQQYDYIYLKGSKKIAATNDVGDDGIVDGSSAITKTMRIQFGSSGGKFEILFWSWFPTMQENSMDPENPEAVANESKFLRWPDQITEIVILRNPSHIFISNNLTNKERAQWATIVLTAYFFGGYWQFSLSGKNSLRLKCNA